MKLNPEAVRARRERARRDGQRVEARREASGNASLAGRELDTADVLASRAYIDAVAARLRASGIGGSLDRLRALALTDLTQGRDPRDRITLEPATPSGPGPASAPVPGRFAPAARHRSRPWSTSSCPPERCSASPPRPLRPAPGACWTAKRLRSLPPPRRRTRAPGGA